MALRILEELEHEKEIVELYQGCGDARLKWSIIDKLSDRVFGKPTQKTEDKIVFDPNAPLRVIVEHMGRPQDQVPAQAKRT